MLSPFTPSKSLRVALLRYSIDIQKGGQVVVNYRPTLLFLLEKNAPIDESNLSTRQFALIRTEDGVPPDYCLDPLQVFRLRNEEGIRGLVALIKLLK